jgi:hypothetical protein
MQKLTAMQFKSAIQLYQNFVKLQVHVLHPKARGVLTSTSRGKTFTEAGSYLHLAERFYWPVKENVNTCILNRQTYVHR